MKPYEYYWIEHFLKHAILVDTLPFGWCVYREPVDFYD